jgi:hypothetical protein
MPTATPTPRPEFEPVEIDIVKYSFIVDLYPGDGERVWLTSTSSAFDEDESASRAMSPDQARDLAAALVEAARAADGDGPGF